MEKHIKEISFTNDIYDTNFHEEVNLIYRPLKAWLRNELGSKYFYRVRFNDFSPVDYIDQKIIDIARTNKNFYIILDQTLEAYAYKNFQNINKFVKEHSLYKKVIFVSALSEVKKEYEFWRSHNLEIERFYVAHYNSWLTSTRRYFLDTNIEFDLKKKTWFCCLNHRPHPHRVSTLVYLDYLNLIDQGIVTGHDRNYEYRLENVDKYNNFENHLGAAIKGFEPSYAKILYNQREITKPKLPLVYDLEDIGDGCQPFKITESIFNDCLINLVTETFYFNHWNYESEIFITEKTIKAILSKQIFIIVGPKGILKKLRSMGIETFSDYIDESYDDAPDSIRMFKAIESLNTAMKTYSLDELSRLTEKIRKKNFKTYLKINFNINISDILRE